MKFKVGDFVKLIDTSHCKDYYILGKVYTIYTISSVGVGLAISHQYYLDDIEDMFAWEKEIKLVHVDTKLNRLLYPDYTLVNGYLEKKDDKY